MFLAAYAMPTFGLEEVARLTASDATAGYGEGFGASVANYGDWIAVGAPGDDEFVDGMGAVYLFRRDGANWIEEQKLKGRGIYHEGTGNSLAMNGDWLVVGAPDLPSGIVVGAQGIGRAYVFQRLDGLSLEDPTDDRWAEAAILSPPPSHLCCNFGITVDVAGNVIVVGSTRGAVEEGRAYVFRWDGSEWSFETTLASNDALAGDAFGATVATNGNDILIGAHRSDVLGHLVGRVFVFSFSESHWIEMEDLLPGDGGFGGQFGISLAIHEDFAAIGRIHRIYLLRQEPFGWKENAKLGPSDSAGEFGKTLAAAKDLVLVGAPFDDDRGSNTGSVFVFRSRDGVWTEEAKLFASNASPGASLGSALSTDGFHSVATSVHTAYVYRTCGGCGTIREYGRLQRCFGQGSTAAESTICARLDLNSDGDVDLEDYSVILATFIGP